MKKLSINFRLVCLMMATLLASCSHDGVTDDTGINPEQQNKIISLSFPDRYVDLGATKATYPANVQERTLTNVDLYLFTDNGSGQPDQFAATLPVVLGTTVGKNTPATVDVTSLAYGSYHIVAVANKTIPLASIPVGTPFNNFCDLIMTDFPKSSSTFIMTSIPQPFNFVKGIVPQIDPIYLTRLAVRIDIRNEATNAPNPFVLSHARIANAVDRSYLIKRGSSKRIGVGTALDKNLTWVENAKTGIVYNAEMFANLYTFENDEVSPSTTQTYVQIRGTYKGELVEFDVPFEDRAVVRNTRYLIIIKSLPQHDLDFEVKVLDWNEGEIIPYDPFLPALPSPKISGIDPIHPDKTTIMTAPVKGDYEGVVFKYVSGEDQIFTNIESMTIPFWRTRYDFNIEFEEEVEIVVDGASSYSDSWVCETESMETTSVVNPDADGKYKQKFRIVFEANDLANEQTRELTLVIRSKTDHGMKKEIKIKQIGLPDLVGMFSPSYLSGLNQLDSQPMNEATVGNGGFNTAYFQWGRNVALYGNGTETVDATTNTGNNNTILFANNMMYKNLYGGTTFKNYWTDQVKAAENTSNPAWAAYKGSNMTYPGDPCPEGWHIPNRDEYWTLLLGFKNRSTGGFPINTWDCVNFRETADRESTVKGTPYSHSLTNFQNENTTVYGWKHIGQSFYYAKAGEDVFYGLKHVQDPSDIKYYMYENALKSAMKYEMKQTAGGYIYFKITTRHIGEGVGKPNSMTDLKNIIADDNYWNTNNANDKVLIIPAQGYLAGNAMNEVVLTFAGTYTYDYMGNKQSNTGNTLRAGFIGAKTNYYPNHYTLSTCWSYAGGMAQPVRCIRNMAANPGVNKTWNWPAQ